MRFLNVLAAVHPRLREIVWHTLRQNADVSFVDTLDRAIRDLELRGRLLERSDVDVQWRSTQLVRNT
jgi:hypothetical protein